MRQKIKSKIAAVVIMLLAIVIAALIYTMEFRWQDQSLDLSKAMNAYIDPDDGADVSVLDFEMSGNHLIAFYKDMNNPDIYGFGHFIRGINGRYRLIEEISSAIPYSAVIASCQFDLSGQKAYILGGYGCADAAAYGLTIMGIQGNKTGLVQFPMEEEPFVRIVKEEEIKAQLVSAGEGAYGKGALLSADGKDMTESYQLEGIDYAWGSETSGAKQYLVYTYMVIVLLLGTLLGRHFWKK